MADGYYYDDGDDTGWQTVKYRRGRLFNPEANNAHGQPQPCLVRCEAHSSPANYEPPHYNANQATHSATGPASYHPQSTYQPANSYGDANNSYRPANSFPNNANRSYNYNGASYAQVTASNNRTFQNYNRSNQRANYQNNNRGSFNYKWNNNNRSSRGGYNGGFRRGQNYNGPRWQRNQRFGNRGWNRDPSQGRQSAGYNNYKQSGNYKPPQQAANNNQDTNFTVKTRAIHRVIKASHHLQNVSSQNVPRAISNITDLLIDSIKPADSNQATGEKIWGNAKMWEHTTLLILRDHYADSIKNNLLILQQLRTGAWQKNFEIAAKWARNHYGKKLTRETLDSAYARVVDAMQCQTPTAVQTQPPAPVQTETQTAAPTRPDSGERYAELQRRSREATPQPQPPPVALRDASTDPIPPPAHDWSRIETLTEDGPPTTAQPLPQRTPRAAQHTMRPAPTSGPQVVSVEVHPTSKDQEQQTEPTTTERQMATDGPPQLSFYPPHPTFPSDLSPLFSSPKPPPPFPPRLSLPSLSDPTADSSGPQIHHQTSPSETPTVLRQKPTTPTALRITISDVDTPEKPREVTVTDNPPIHHRLVPVNKNTIQSRLSFDTPSLRPREFTPHRNPHVQDKLNDWSLIPNKKWLILGDSNLSRFPNYTEPHIQIESFPGANFKHARAILARAPVSKEVEKVILSFGINHKSHNPDTTIPQIDQAISMAKNTFPKARIMVPIINYSRSLPDIEKENLNALNDHIVCYDDIVPHLSRNRFSTGDDLVHWTEETAEHILDHWIAHLNGSSP